MSIIICFLSLLSVGRYVHFVSSHSLWPVLAQAETPVRITDNQRPLAVQVNGRIMRKRIHVRVEHIVPSRCREDFLKRRTDNENKKKEAKASGGAYQCL